MINKEASDVSREVKSFDNTKMATLNRWFIRYIHVPEKKENKVHDRSEF